MIVQRRATLAARLNVVACIAAFLSLVVVTVAGGVFCVCRVLAKFLDHDDQGFMMLTIRQMLGGRQLYTELLQAYGPLYYASRWLLHSLFQVPLTHDAVRLITAASWMATGGILAVAIAKIGRQTAISIWFSAIVLAAATLHLWTLENEPGHPQEIVLLGVAAAFVAAACAGGNPSLRTYAILGAIAVGLLLTKINIGVFFTAACLLALSFSVPGGRLWSVWRWLLVAGTLALPPLLMRPRLDTAWARNFVCCVDISLLISLWVIWRAGAAQPPGFANQADHEVSPTHALCGRSTLAWRARRRWEEMQESGRLLLGFGVGAVAMAAVLLAFTLAAGGSLAGLLTCLIINPARTYQGATLGYPINIDPYAWCWSLVAVALAYVSVQTRSGPAGPLWHAVIGWGKLGVAIFLFWTALGDSFVALSWGPCCTWLVLLLPPGRQVPWSELLLRRLLALVTPLQMLQVYPIPGTSQALVGSVGLVLVAAICLLDGFITIGYLWPQYGRPIGAAVCVAAGLMPISALVRSAPHVISFYERCRPVSFPGCRLSRLPLHQAVLYGWLADNVRDSDAFIAKFGLNSLYFWTGRPPAVQTPISWSWRPIPDSLQREMIDECRHAGDVLAIDHPGEIDIYPWEETVFGQYIRSDFHPVARFGNYTLARRNDLPDKPLQGCAWFTSGNIETSSSTRDIELGTLDWNSVAGTNRYLLVDLAHGACVADSMSETATRRIRYEAGRSKDAATKLAVSKRLSLEKCFYPAILIVDPDGNILSALPVVRHFTGNVPATAALDAAAR